MAAGLVVAHTQEPHPLRLAIAGLVHGHVSGFLRSTPGRHDVEIVGVFDPDARLLAQYGERFRFDRSVLFTDLVAMLDRTKPEAVASFSSTDDHPGIVEAAPRIGADGSARAAGEAELNATCGGYAMQSMRIEPHISLVFNGECDAAFTLYQQCLGGSVTFRLTWGDSPMADQAPSEWRNKILHATLTVGDTALAGGDVLPGQYERPQGFQLQLNMDDATAAERIFAQLAEGGRVTVPLQQTFWAQRFGAVVDRFGIPWGVNCGERKMV